MELTRCLSSRLEFVSSIFRWIWWRTRRDFIDGPMRNVLRVFERSLLRMPRNWPTKVFRFFFSFIDRRMKKRWKHSPNKSIDNFFINEVRRTNETNERREISLALINCLHADGEQFGHALNHLGKSLNDLPLLIIDSFEHMFVFPHFSQIE